MGVLAAGTRAPSFRLVRGDGAGFTEQDPRANRTVLVFYPFAFAEVNKAIQGAHA